MYILLAWFASDNIMSWLSSPILFYPLILLFALLTAAWNLGLMPIIMNRVIPLAKLQINAVLMATGVPFRV